MGMRISTSSVAGAGGAASVWQQRQADMKSLFSAIQSGDLSSAQQAFSKVTGGSSTVNAQSPLAAIGQALAKGDIQGAQDASQQLQARRAGHHHVQAAQLQPATGSQAVSSSGPGSLLNIMA